MVVNTQGTLEKKGLKINFGVRGLHEQGVFPCV